MIKRDPWQRKLIKTDIGGEWKREENEKGKREPPHSKISVSKYTPTRRWRRKDGKRRKTRTLHMAATGLVHTRLYFVLFRPRRASWRRWRRKGDSIQTLPRGRYTGCMKNTYHNHTRKSFPADVSPLHTVLSETEEDCSCSPIPHPLELPDKFSSNSYISSSNYL